MANKGTPEDWLRIYYPKPASEAIATQFEAAEHSLKKWEGLREVSEYGIVLVDATLRLVPPTGFLPIDGSTCALCQYSKAQCRANLEHYDVMCSYCPLAIVRGEDCQTPRDDEGRSPYQVFTYEDNPEPMIEWLQKTVEYLKKEEEIVKSEPTGPVRE